MLRSNLRIDVDGFKSFSHLGVLDEEAAARLLLSFCVFGEAHVEEPKRVFEVGFDAWFGRARIFMIAESTLRPW